MTFSGGVDDSGCGLAILVDGTIPRLFLGQALVLGSLDQQFHLGDSVLISSSEVDVITEISVFASLLLSQHVCSEVWMINDGLSGLDPVAPDGTVNKRCVPSVWVH